MPLRFHCIRSELAPNGWLGENVRIILLVQHIVSDMLTAHTAEVKEGKTTPPKHYTEDTLLSAMETAGVKDILSLFPRYRVFPVAFPLISQKFRLQMARTLYLFLN